MKKFFLLFKIISLLAILNILALSFTAFFLLWKYSPDLPSYSELKNYNPPLSTRVYTSDGVLLDKYYIEERLFVPIDRIPNILKNAFISAEDKNFYSHYGFDLFAISRAFVTNIINYINNDKRLIGASTITQQVVKNMLLTNEVSFERKIKEIILAIRLEIILSKDKILELYLNDIYLGYGSYGVAAASLNYFNKSLNELSLEEAAFLAALPKAPNNYHPVKKYESAVNRRNWVIDQMYKNKYILKNHLSKKNTKLIVKDRDLIDLNKAQYFKEEVRKKLNNLYGNKNLYRDGLIVKTTIDTNLQTFADEALIEGLLNFDIKNNGWRGILKKNINIISNDLIKEFKNPFPNKWRLSLVKKVKNDFIQISTQNTKDEIISINSNNEWLKKINIEVGDVFFTEKIENEIIVRQIPNVNGAIIVLDPHTGKILALTGGFSFKLSEFNRVTQAKRQPGSAFKPFVYITALEEGYTPSTLILDAPYVIDQGPGLPKWKPSNYTDKFYGLSTMRIGIEKSRNLMTIRLADRLGMEKILRTAKKFNIDQNIDMNLSMSLGAGVVTLENLTSAYAMIVNGGKKIKTKLIESVSNKRGKIIYNSQEKECINCIQYSDNLIYDLPVIEENKESIINSTVAYQMSSMLEGVVLRGTGKKISDLQTPLGGKTGTTNDNKDAWFIGFSPDLVVGVYVGYDNPKSLGYKQTGSSVAVPIFKSFMKKIDVNKNKIPFRIPSGISFVKIDTQTGLQTNSNNGILESFLIGTEPFNQNITVLDSLGSVQQETLSGVGNLLIY